MKRAEPKQIESGAIVTLRCGGQKMCVAEVNDNGAQLWWLDTNHHLQSASLPLCVLDEAPTEGPSADLNLQ